MKLIAGIVMVCLIGCAGRPARQEVVSFSKADREAILQAVLCDVMTHPHLEHTREFYGRVGDTRVALVTNSPFGIDWPEGFKPFVPGHDLSRLAWPSDRDRSKPHLLGIVLSRCDLAERTSLPLTRPPIELQVMNVGGNGDQPVAGRCFVWYTVERQGQSWVVLLNGLAD